MPTSGKSFKRFFQRNVNFSTTCVNRDELLDQENRMAAERLAAKVASLKSFTMDIESEAREHNSLLDEMSSGFESTFGFLTTGRNRVNRLISSGRGNRRFMCYLSVAITALLFLVYILISRSISSS